jgi:hypothetical protein
MYTHRSAHARMNIHIYIASRKVLQPNKVEKVTCSFPLRCKPLLSIPLLIRCCNNNAFQRQAPSLRHTSVAVLSTYLTGFNAKKLFA